MPISITTAFTFKWELLGLWTGVAVALVFVAVVETAIIMRTDWDKVDSPLPFSFCENERG